MVDLKPCENCSRVHATWRIELDVKLEPAGRTFEQARVYSIFSEYSVRLFVCSSYKRLDML